MGLITMISESSFIRSGLHMKGEVYNATTTKKEATFETIFFLWISFLHFFHIESQWPRLTGGGNSSLAWAEVLDPIFSLLPYPSHCTTEKFILLFVKYSNSWCFSSVQLIYNWLTLQLDPRFSATHTLNMDIRAVFQTGVVLWPRPFCDTPWTLYTELWTLASGHVMTVPLYSNCTITYQLYVL